MRQVNVRFRWIDLERCQDLSLPSYESAQAAGMDAAVAVTENTTLHPGEIKLLPTGFAVALPDNFELQVRSRSGLAVKHGIIVVNSPGTIDADYRGEVKIGLINLGQEPFTVRRGDRVAQLVLAPVCQARLQVVRELDVTERGDGGFGHTGI
jgi:dUTP pyrophosphatase